MKYRAPGHGVQASGEPASAAASGAAASGTAASAAVSPPPQAAAEMSATPAAKAIGLRVGTTVAGREYIVPHPQSNPGPRTSCAIGREVRKVCAPSPEELVAHVRPGPRYTSYPPATEFRPAFTAADAGEQLARLARRPDRIASLYLHVPYCASLCWYCGCNVVISRDRGKATGYVDRLVREIDALATRSGRGRPLAELSLGGGSPNFLPADELVRLVGAVCRAFELTADAELGIELDPRETTAEQIDALADCGFTRMSVGVQDFAPLVQRAIHREQSIEQTAELIARGRAAGFRSANVDLVYGLPGQTEDSLRATLDAVVRMAPDRIAMFGYAHLPHLRPHQKLVERAAAVPGPDHRARLLAVALEAFDAAGYVRVGLDHFARPDDPLVRAALDGRLHRNFQGYVVQRGDVLLGCGSSAITDTGDAYWQNHVDVDEWGRAVDAGQLPVARGVALDGDDQVRRYVITRLMCDAELDMADVERRFEIDFDRYFSPELDALAGRDLAPLVEVDRDARRIVATPLGTQLIRNVCMAFDRYLRERADRPRFSPTL
ncbi:MAG: oxygen-independent coproporphyrinogen III oxidase [Deltaproteobacteria bacterium]|nr:MAG: oxygen-independent coproporphyrinogen III oxidase [Deltaproteobacteria bacterium]